MKNLIQAFQDLLKNYKNIEDWIIFSCIHILAQKLENQEKVPFFPTYGVSKNKSYAWKNILVRNISVSIEIMIKIENIYLNFISIYRLMRVGQRWGILFWKLYFIAVGITKNLTLCAPWNSIFKWTLTKKILFQIKLRTYDQRWKYLS